jgi:hypothetical protein
MRIDTHATSFLAVLISWTAAVAAAGLALVLAVIGQGVGAMAGGCGWIGATIPINRQVWALVNQPVLNFSSLPAAGGYWLGSTALPMLVAVLLLTVRVRKPTVVGQLMLIQAAWWASILGGTWLPLLDPVDGHLSRWLLLHRLPPALVWIAPAGSIILATLASSRLLELARAAHPDLGRGTRTVMILLHLILPVAGWLVAVSFIGHGAPPVPSSLGVAAPATAAVVFGFIRYPSPFSRPLEGPSPPAVGVLLVGAATLVGAMWFAGGPLPGGRARGVVWDSPESFNNIRPWIVLSWTAEDGAADHRPTDGAGGGIGR